MSAAGQWLLILIIGLSLLGIEPLPVEARPAMQSSSLTMVSPTACPAAGCAPGQRMNMRFDFELGRYDPLPSTPPAPNVKVCIYAPAGWINLNSVNRADQSGGVTGLPYTAAAGCSEDSAPPTGYILVDARQAEIVNINAFSDSLNLSFRIDSSTQTTGKVLARLFERSTSGWQPTQQVFTANLPMVPPSALAFAAANASLCDSGGYQPCFLNSGDDLPDGIGTGLKDAIDAVQPGSIIYLVGSYPIKSSTVRVNKAVQISGVNMASLIGSGSVCTNAMLRIEDAVTLRDLAINDGPGCTASSRTLIEINSAQNVIIENNRLFGGDRAVTVRDNSGAVIVRFNQIENNAAQAVYADNGAIFGPLTVEANNITGNGGTVNGAQIECAGGQGGVVTNRKANHNYWGSPSAPSQDATHCLISPGRQLGAPIQPRSGAHGVQAQRFTVTGNKTYAYNNEIAFQRSGGDSDFDLYIVNHGYAQVGFTPFNLAGGPNPCSNFWDVFLPDGVTPNGSLELFFKYNKSAACVAAINSSQYCDQTSDPSKYPLWWYDPATNVTNLWDTTGQNPAGSNAGGGSGQVTTCRIGDSEIQVSIDATGRPNLANDLTYLPFFTGIQVLNTFQLLASSNIITVNWTTNSEPDVAGFYVQRSTDNINFSPITDLIARRGSALGGSNYSFVDSGRVSGTTYYYRLQILRPDNNILYSNVLSSVGTAATATTTNTPTQTGIPGTTATFTRTPGPSPTFTPPPPTRTRTPTRVPLQNPTRAPSATPSPRAATPTRLSLTLPTAGTPGTGTVTTSGTQSGYPAPGETQDGAYPAPGTSYPTSVSGYPAPGGASLTAPAYPGPGDEQTPTPAGTPVAGLISPTATLSGGPGPAVSPGSPSGLLQALLAGYFGGSALLGLLGLWVFVIRRPQNPLQ